MCRTKRARILVVENDTGWRGLLTEILKGQHYSVDSAVSLSAARPLVQSDPKHDLALVDLHLISTDMNNRDGIEVCKLAKSRGIPVLVVSVFGGRDTAEEIAGVYDDFVDKNAWERDEFIQKVDVLLNRAGSHQAGATASFLSRLIEGTLTDMLAALVLWGAVVVVGYLLGDYAGILDDLPAGLFATAESAVYTAIVLVVGFVVAVLVLLLQRRQ